MVAETVDFETSFSSTFSSPSNLLNCPRTFVTTRWVTVNPVLGSGRRPTPPHRRVMGRAARRRRETLSVRIMVGSWTGNPVTPLTGHHGLEINLT
jgi:hypothetical protein